jgi:hypothetical protein
VAAAGSGEFARACGADTLEDLPVHVDAFVTRRAVRQQRAHRRGDRVRVGREVRGPIEQLLRPVVPGFDGRGRPHRRAPFAEAAEERVSNALVKLTKTGALFTVENVGYPAGVGKTFIYDKRHPQLTKAVLATRDASQGAAALRAERRLDGETPTWRERAINAEALAKSLPITIKERDARIGDLIGQIYDSEGTHLAEHNVELRQLVATLNLTLQQLRIENNALRRSLDAARANVKREPERNVTQLFAEQRKH